MSVQAEHYLFGVFLILCRVGVAFNLMPAMGGTRYPMIVRLLFALGMSFSMAPLVKFTTAMQKLVPSEQLLAIFTELFTGLVIGFWCFCFIYAVRFAGTFIVNAIGLAGVPGQPIDEQEPSSHIATLLSLGITAMIFAADLHLQSIEAMIESYRVFPIAAPITGEAATKTTVEILGRSFYLGLQFSSPFLVFSVIWNMALGIANKLTPQLSVYFAFSGILTIVSLGLLAVVAPKLLYLPLAAYGDFLANGFR